MTATYAINPDAVRQAALTAYEAGLNVFPPRTDGSKAPLSAWGEYEKKRVTREQIKGLYGNGRTGIGLICGAISGNLEAFDVDEHGLYARFREAMQEAQLSDLLERIEAGYHELTPRGDHLLYQCEAVSGNTKLAKRPKRPEEMVDANDKVKTLMETRGEGGYIIVAPTHGSVNPDGAYELVSGGFDTIVTITPEEREALFTIARTFDEMPRQLFDEPKRDPILRRADEQLPGWEIRPGDDFNQRADWRDVLEPHGWKLAQKKGDVDRWAKPGKQHHGWSATTNHAASDLLYVFTTSTALDPERGYSKFSAYALLTHNGDFAAAAKKLAEDGYGKRAESGASVSSVLTVIPPEDWLEADPIFGPPPAPSLSLDLVPVEIANIAQDVAERQQAPVDFVVWPLLVSAAGLIGRGAGIRPRAFDDWTERPALWVTQIGPPSSLKTPAQDEGTRGLRRQQERDHEIYLRALADWKADCAAAKQVDPKHPDLPPAPTERRCWTADVTIEKLAILLTPEVSRGLTVYRDELAGLILDLDKYHQKGGDRQFYLQAYTGGPYTVDRVQRESLFIPDLLVNVVGGIQPEVARAIFGGGPDDGFAARFLSIWPEPDATWHRVDRWPNRTARQAMDAINYRVAATDWQAELALDDFKPTPYCRLASEGQQLFDQWHEGMMTSLRAGQYQGRLEGRVGKYPGLAARLILVYHLIEWAAGRSPQAAIVTAETVASVLELVDEYVLPMEQRVYSAYAVPPDAEGGRRIARWLQTASPAPAQFTAREILRRDWAGLQDAATVAAALDWLVTRRWLREAEPEKRPGRPSNVYMVNPRLEAHRG